MSGPLGKRIEDTQQRIVALRDQLTNHIASMDDENPDETAIVTSDELNSQIETQEKALTALKRAEQNLAATAQRNAIVTYADGASSAQEVRAVPFASASSSKKVRPVDYLWRSLAVAVKHNVEHGSRPVLDILKESYGEDEATRTVLAKMVTRAAVVPATTTGSGWADTLVQTVIGDFIESLYPYSIYPKLAAAGSSFTFGRNGIISLPARSATPTVSGAFVLQGNAIPVKQAAFSPIVLTPKKLGVITTMTREITEHSTPAIEGIIRQAMLDDTGVAIDTVLLDANVATATRPAGLQSSGVGTAKTGTAGGPGIVPLIADLKQLVNGLISASAGNVRKPVWLMNPSDVLSMSLTQAAAGGMLPFRDELASGTLLGYQVIQSTIVPARSMYLMDAADFMTATGDTPRFDVSDHATLHMEDTAPLQISTVGSPNVVAAPVRSLYQTDSLAIRMVMDLNWAYRHPGTVIFVTVMTW